MHHTFTSYALRAALLRGTSLSGALEYKQRDSSYFLETMLRYF